MHTLKPKISQNCTDKTGLQFNLLYSNRSSESLRCIWVLAKALLHFWCSHCIIDTWNEDMCSLQHCRSKAFLCDLSVLSTEISSFKDIMQGWDKKELSWLCPLVIMVFLVTPPPQMAQYTGELKAVLNLAEAQYIHGGVKLCRSHSML